MVWNAPHVDLSDQNRTELQSVIKSALYDGSVSSRAQIVLWYAEGYRKTEIVAMSGATRPAVDKWLNRYEEEGVAGLVSRTSPGGRGRSRTGYGRRFWR